MGYFALKIETNGLIGEDENGKSELVSVLQVCITNLSSKIIFSKMYGLSESQKLSQNAQQFNEIRETDLIGCSPFTLKDFNKELKALSANSPISLLVTSSEFYSKIFAQYGKLQKEVKLVDIGKLCAEKLGKTKSYYRNLYITDRAYNGCINIVEYARDYKLLGDNEIYDEELLDLDF